MKLVKIVYIKRLLDDLLNFVDTDYRNATNPTDSWLYRMLYDPSDTSDFNFYEQAVACLVDRTLSPTKIQTGIGFNKNTNGSPYIHIRESAKQKGTYNAIGGIEEDVWLNDDKRVATSIYRATKKSEYEMIVTSNNQMLTILIADVIDALLTGAWESISNEFDLFDLVVKDMMVNQDTNTPLYIKSVALSCQYQNNIPSIYLSTNAVTNSINFTLNNINNEEIVYGD